MCESVSEWECVSECVSVWAPLIQLGGVGGAHTRRWDEAEGWVGWVGGPAG